MAGRPSPQKNDDSIIYPPKPDTPDNPPVHEADLEKSFEDCVRELQTAKDAGKTNEKEGKLIYKAIQAMRYKSLPSLSEDEKAELMEIHSRLSK